MPLVVQFFFWNTVHSTVETLNHNGVYLKEKAGPSVIPRLSGKPATDTDRKAPSDGLIGPSDSTVIGWNMWYRLNFCVFHLLPNSCTEWQCCISCKYAASGYTSRLRQVIYWGSICLVPRVETKLTTTGRAETSADISNFLTTVLMTVSAETVTVTWDALSGPASAA